MVALPNAAAVIEAFPAGFRWRYFAFLLRYARDACIDGILSPAAVSVKEC